MLFLERDIVVGIKSTVGWTQMGRISDDDDDDDDDGGNDDNDDV